MTGVERCPDWSGREVETARKECPRGTAAQHLLARGAG
jgi:hypothetical protein